MDRGRKLGLSVPRVPRILMKIFKNLARQTTRCSRQEQFQPALRTFPSGREHGGGEKERRDADVGGGGEGKRD